MKPREYSSRKKQGSALRISPSSVVQAHRAVSTHLVQRRIAQLVRFAIGASAGSLMLAAHAQSSGSPCTQASPNACLIYSIGAPGANGSEPDFDKSGKSGGNGTSGNALSATFNGVPPVRYLSSGNSTNPDDEYPAIYMTSVGGNGGSGSNASGGRDAPILNLNGGNGGAAGTGGNLSLTITQGAQVQAVMSDPPNVYTSDQAPAIGLVSVGGTGGGGGVPSEGGTEGASANGGAAGNVTVQDFANPNQTDPTTGITAAVIGAGSGIVAASYSGNGGAGNNHVSGYSKFGVDGGNALPGGSVNVTTGTSIVAFDSGRGAALSSGDVGAGIWAISAGGNGGAGGSTGTAQAGGQGAVARRHRRGGRHRGRHR
jgi:hypothetical protein